MIIIKLFMHFKDRKLLFLPRHCMIDLVLIVQFEHGAYLSFLRLNLIKTNKHICGILNM